MPDVGSHAALHQATDPSIDQGANSSYETIQSAKGGLREALFDEFFWICVDHHRQIVCHAHCVQKGAHDNPACLFAIREDLVIFAHHLMMAVQCPVMIVPRKAI